MAREGLRGLQVAFYHGRKTTTELNTLISSGDLLEGDFAYNTDIKKQVVYSSTTSSWVQNSGGASSGDLTLSLATVAEARKRGSDILLPIPNTMVEANEAGRVTIGLHTTYTNGTTELKLTEKIFIEDGASIPLYITNDTTGDYDLIWLDSLTASASGEYTYSLTASIATDYTTTNNSYVTNSIAKIASKQAQPNSDSTGDAAKSLESLLVQYTENGTLSTANIQAYHKFYSQKFPADLSNYSASQEISFDDGGADHSSWYKDKDLIVLTKMLDENSDELVYLYKDLKQYRGGNDTSWYIFQLNGDATYPSSPNIIATVDGVVSKTDGTIGSTLPTISDTDNWFVFRLGGLLKFLAGAKTSTTLANLTPVELIVNSKSGKGGLLTEDSFERADNTTVGNGWTDPGNCRIHTNALNNDTGIGVVNDSSIYRNDISYDEEDYLPIEATFEFNLNRDAIGGNAVGVISLMFGSDLATDGAESGGQNGSAFCFKYDHNDGGKTYILFNKNGSNVRNTDITGITTLDAYHNCRVRLEKTSMKAKIWNIGSNEPVDWMYETETTFSPEGDYLQIEMYTADGMDDRLRNLKIKSMVGNFIVKYEGTGTNVDKWALQDPSVVNSTADPLVTYDFGGALY